MQCNILFNGSSFIFGGELEGPNKDLEHQRTHRFSHLVAEHYNATYSNLSEGGISNDWIVETTISWIEEGNICDLAIIQFAPRNRILLYTHNKKELHGIPVQKNQLVDLKKQKNFLDKWKICDNYYGLIYTDYLGTQNYYKNLFFLATYLKQKNINYIFLVTNLEISDESIGWQSKCKDIVIQPIQNNIIPRKSEDPSYYCKNYAAISKKYPFWLTGFHPNELGHKKIAEYIINEIDKNQYLK